ncbi:MAG TPA: hypothetical protein VL049_23005 [Candidatus Dormibacteraeota bacterium]|nr:hypothetical protein [Candidatus Dormibacteraeota bacterium]
MSALTIATVINVAPLGAAALDGIIVFPVPEALGWLIVTGLLAIACAILAMLSGRQPRPPVRRVTRPRGFRPAQPQPQRP